MGNQWFPIVYGWFCLENAKACLSGSHLEHQALPGAKNLQICSPEVSDWNCVWDFENYFSASKKSILKILIFFLRFFNFRWLSMVSHCNFHWIWWDLDQNPSESRKFSKNQPISAARGSWEASLTIFKRYVSRGVHFWGLCCDLKTFGARKPKKTWFSWFFTKVWKIDSPSTMTPTVVPLVPPRRGD